VAGYSGTPLVRKLGIKADYRVRIGGAPGDYAELIRPLPDNVLISSRITSDIHIWHFFTRSKTALAKSLPKMLKQIRQDGMIWISWPKKASGVTSTVTEDTVRELALPLGLVDIKVCAIDNTWSGLKLVIRKELRHN